MIGFRRIPFAVKPFRRTLQRCALAIIALSIALMGATAQAESTLVDLRSHGTDAPYFVSFVALSPKSAGQQPSVLVVWGDPRVAAAGSAYESVGLISLNAAAYFGRLPDNIVQQLHFEQLSAGTPPARSVSDSLTVLVDEDAYKDAYEVFGGNRQGTYFEDQTIAPTDGAARSHGIGQIISFFAGIGSRLGESVPDTLHLASTAVDDPLHTTSAFSPQLYLRSMIATAISSRDLLYLTGTWSGETFGQWPNGTGLLSYLSGASYSGELHRGERRGTGTWLGTDGLTISGQFDADQPVEASIAFPDGDTYTGSLKDYRLVQGTYHWHDGSCYVGSFGLSEQPVDGTLTTADGLSIAIAQGLPQPLGLAPSADALPRVNRLFAYAVDFTN